jgi:hypothetical protein
MGAAAMGAAATGATATVVTTTGAAMWEAAGTTPTEAEAKGAAAMGADADAMQLFNRTSVFTHNYLLSNQGILKSIDLSISNPE